MVEIKRQGTSFFYVELLIVRHLHMLSPGLNLNQSLACSHKVLRRFLILWLCVKVLVVVLISCVIRERSDPRSPSMIVLVVGPDSVLLDDQLAHAV